MKALSVLEIKHEIAPYRGSLDALPKIAVAFRGVLQKSQHPHHVMLLNDPLNQQGYMYEFLTEDVVYVEEVSSLAVQEGSAITLVRLWIKKGARGLKVEPFRVEETASLMHAFYSF